MSFALTHSLPHFSRAQNNVRGFSEDADLIPALGYSRGARRAVIKKLRLRGVADITDKAQRKMRRERRAAAVYVLLRMLHLSDPAKGVVQVPLKAVADFCGLNPRRVDRVIRDLRRAGILHTVRRPCAMDKRGNIKPTAAAVRRWSREFLELVRVSELWDKWRARRKRQAQKANLTDTMRARGAQWEFADIKARRRAKIKPDAPPPDDDASAPPGHYSHWVDKNGRRCTSYLDMVKNGAKRVYGG